jgi:hypothetical protein
VTTNEKPLNTIIAASASVLAILGAVFYVAGWLYRTAYLAEFGIPPLGEALYSYLLNSWAILFAFVGIMILIGYAAIAVLRSQKQGTKLGNYPTKRSLVFVIVGGVSFAIILGLLAAGENSETLSLPLLIVWPALLVFCFVLFIWSAQMKYFVALIVIAPMMLFVYAWFFGAQDAQSHMALERSRFSIPSRTLEVVTVRTKAPLKPGTPVTDCPCTYSNLRLVAFQDDRYYLYDPQAQSSHNPPSAYVVPEDNILSLVLEPASFPVTVTLPVATGTITTTQVVSPTLVVPAPILLPSQSPIP